MKICSLCSGSSGNCSYIEISGYKILIDGGKTKKYIVDALKQIDVDYKDIDYVLLTHTHDDHTSALRTFLKDHKASLVLSNEMLLQLNDLDGLHIIGYDDNPNIPYLDLETIKLSHDSGDTRGFIFTEGDKSLVYITDTGYLNTKYINKLKGKTMYAIESNHDIELLTHGPYPEWLKKRVLSDVGHLSNKFTGIYLSKMISDNTKHVMLLHLSDKNNDKTVALNTAKEYLGDNKIDLFCADRDTVSKVVKL